jgi:hypothetical protein
VSLAVVVAAGTNTRTCSMDVPPHRDDFDEPTAAQDPRRCNSLQVVFIVALVASVVRRLGAVQQNNGERLE